MSAELLQDSEPWDRQWLESMGFSPPNDDDEMMLRFPGPNLIDENVLVVDLSEWAFIVDASYDVEQCGVYLGKRRTKGEVRLLCRALGKELPR